MKERRTKYRHNLPRTEPSHLLKIKDKEGIPTDHVHYLLRVIQQVNVK